MFASPEMSYCRTLPRSTQNVSAIASPSLMKVWRLQLRCLGSSSCRWCLDLAGNYANESRMMMGKGETLPPRGLNHLPSKGKDVT